MQSIRFYRLESNNVIKFCICFHFHFVFCTGKSLANRSNWYLKRIALFCAQLLWCLNWAAKQLSSHSLNKIYIFSFITYLIPSIPSFSFNVSTYSIGHECHTNHLWISFATAQQQMLTKKIEYAAKPSSYVHILTCQFKLLLQMNSTVKEYRAEKAGTKYVRKRARERSINHVWIKINYYEKVQENHSRKLILWWLATWRNGVSEYLRDNQCQWTIWSLNDKQNRKLIRKWEQAKPKQTKIVIGLNTINDWPIHSMVTIFYSNGVEFISNFDWINSICSDFGLRSCAGLIFYVV